MPWPMRPTLFEEPPPRRRYRPTEPHELVIIDPATCPACGTATVATTARTDALLRHGGFGATIRVTRRACPSCTWAMVVETAEERPPR